MFRWIVSDDLASLCIAFSGGWWSLLKPIWFPQLKFVCMLFRSGVIVFDDWRLCSLGNVLCRLALYAGALCRANAFNVSFLLLFYRKWRHWRQTTSGWRTRTEHWFVWSASCPNNPQSVFSRLLAQTLENMMCTETQVQERTNNQLQFLCSPRAMLLALQVLTDEDKDGGSFPRLSLPPLTPSGVGCSEGCSASWTSQLERTPPTPLTPSSLPLNRCLWSLSPPFCFARPLVAITAAQWLKQITWSHTLLFSCWILNASISFALDSFTLLGRFNVANKSDNSNASCLWISAHTHTKKHHHLMKTKWNKSRQESLTVVK